MNENRMSSFQHRSMKNLMQCDVFTDEKKSSLNIFECKTREAYKIPFRITENVGLYLLVGILHC